MKEKTILIVENSNTTLYFLKKAFQSDGFNVYTVGTIGEALKLIKENKFDLLFLDYFLKDGTALDLCKEIRAKEHHKKTPIIIFNGQTELINNSIDKCQADLFIEKNKPCSEIVLSTKALLRRIA